MKEEAGYVPDRKIDRYHKLREIMFDDTTIREICKTLRGGAYGKRPIYKDGQIGTVYHRKGVITHNNVEYNMLDIGQLTLFDFVNNLEGLYGIDEDNVLRLDKQNYKNKQ